MKAPNFLTRAWRSVCAAVVWAVTGLRRLYVSLDTYSVAFQYGRWRVVFREDGTWVPGERAFATEGEARFRAAQLNTEERWG